MGIVFLMGALVAISVAMSTKEDRAAARERMRPIGRKLWIPTLALLAWIVATWPRA